MPDTVLNLKLRWQDQMLQPYLCSCHWNDEGKIATKVVIAREPLKFPMLKSCKTNAIKKRWKKQTLQRLLHKCPTKNSKTPISTQSSSAHVEERLGSLSFSLGVCAAVCGAFAYSVFFHLFWRFFGGAAVLQRVFSCILSPSIGQGVRVVTLYLIAFSMNTSCQEGPRQ